MKNVFLTDDKKNIIYPITTSSNVLTQDGCRIEDKLLQYEADLKGITMIFNDVVVPFSDFVEDSTYEGFSYKADIHLDGVTANHYISMQSVHTGEVIYSGIVDSYDGYVTIYSDRIPEEDLIIDTIFATKEVEETSDVILEEVVFKDCETVFNDDGSIQQTYPDGVLNVSFNADGSITETYTYNTGTVITKTTSFNGNIISEVVS